MVELPELSTAEVLGGGLALTTLGVLGGIAASSSNNKAPRRRKSKSRNHGKRSSRNKRKRYTPHTAGKRKDTSRRRIRYTKKGQPYVIKADGRARFISQRGASSSHKRKGGKY